MATYRALPEFYDDEYADLSMLQRDAGFLLSKLPKQRRDVLMLACGTGRVAIPIAQAGHRVVGVDIDPKMLGAAERKRDFVGLHARELSFATQDLLALDLGTKRFDVAAIVFNTFLLFTTLPEQDRVLQHAARHLKRGGTMWIDIFNPDLARIAEDEAINADVKMFLSRELNTGVQRLTHIRDTGKPQVRETTFEYRWFDEKRRAHKRVVKFELTYLFPRELTMLLERNGFIVEACFGNYDGSPVTSNSPRIIAVARKR